MAATPRETAVNSPFLNYKATDCKEREGKIEETNKNETKQVEKGARAEEMAF